MLTAAEVARYRAGLGVTGDEEWEDDTTPPPVRADRGVPPLCGCGCEQEVSWNRVRREWCRHVGYHGRAKGPRAAFEGPGPLCRCGCGRPVARGAGEGKPWNWYRKGHTGGARPAAAALTEGNE